MYRIIYFFMVISLAAVMFNISAVYAADSDEETLCLITWTALNIGYSDHYHGQVLGQSQAFQEVKSLGIESIYSVGYSTSELAQANGLDHPPTSKEGKMLIASNVSKDCFKLLVLSGRL